MCACLIGHLLGLDYQLDYPMNFLVRTLTGLSLRLANIDHRSQCTRNADVNATGIPMFSVVSCSIVTTII